MFLQAGLRHLHLGGVTVASGEEEMPLPRCTLFELTDIFSYE